MKIVILLVIQKIVKSYQALLFLFLNPYLSLKIFHIFLILTSIKMYHNNSLCIYLL
jgi:hypothetical protein